MTDFITQSAATRTISFVDRLANSEMFSALYREGMSLVEETAAYLDGDGRQESKSLPRSASLTYATESMRLTTRLMQLASWLLLQRAVNEGEMTAEQAGSEKNKVRLDKLSTSRNGMGWDELPRRLQDLIERSLRLQERIVHIDRMIHEHADSEPVAAPQVHPLSHHMERLHAAFGARDLN
ncbi:DUF1465 family protein [Stappia sp. F7233]|uniref:DUF1465 family protein n=1 Tax=Stappia albiluteola TaxID=2758565 RepID=A0A839AC41_9HYPH|nr:DUF1465 family protein [Stappia albiluteola]MBA5777290.1 DUF1465 family protein [Stappia albiluteola]